MSPPTLLISSKPKRLYTIMAMYSVAWLMSGTNELSEKSLANPRVTPYATPRIPMMTTMATLQNAAMLETATDRSTPRMPMATTSQHITMAMAASSQGEALGANAMENQLENATNTAGIQNATFTQ